MEDSMHIRTPVIRTVIFGLLTLVSLVIVGLSGARRSIELVVLSLLLFVAFLVPTVVNLSKSLDISRKDDE